MRRIVFDMHFGSYIGVFSEGADRSWLSTKDFEVCFTHWRARLEERRDVFLGYCGASSSTGEKLRDFLEREIRATVLDWRRDFKPGRSILEEIEGARVRCATGIFLFTKDDELRDATGAHQAAPRDNVVFEAGYFASAKGKSRVLIIRQKGAKIPADLGGDIYASPDDKASLSPVEDVIRRFFSIL